MMGRLGAEEKILSDAVAEKETTRREEDGGMAEKKRRRRIESGGMRAAEDLLPNDCWEMIFDKLHDEYNSISLVCKSFLSITNRMRHKLNFPLTDSNSFSRLRGHLRPDYCYHYVSAQEMINRLLLRFPCLTEIHVFRENFSYKKCNIAAIKSVMMEIIKNTSSPTSLVQSLRISCCCDCDRPTRLLKKAAAVSGGLNNNSNIKVLTCSVCNINDRFLQDIGNSFPFLQELYVSYHSCPLASLKVCKRRTITDEGIHFLTRKLKYLKKISLVGEFTETSLVALSSYTSLTHLSLAGSMINTSGRGIGYLLAHCPNMVSLSLPNVLGAVPEVAPPHDDLLSLASFSFTTIENSIASHGKNLQCLELPVGILANDSALSTIAAAKLDLQKISFNAFRCTISGLMSLLSAYNHSLSSLCIEDAEFLNDDSLSTLMSNSPPKNLAEIALRSCRDLTNSSFLLLLRNCPSLSSIEMVDTSLGKGENFHKECCQNENIQQLKLLDNDCMDDETLESIARFCPNLKNVTFEPTLRTRMPYQFTGKGMDKMLKSCNKIRILRLLRDFEISESSIKHLNMGISKLPNLEELYVEDSRMRDEHLALIGNSCCGLLILEIKLNRQITDSSVMVVVQKCKRLKQLGLRYCSRLSKDIKSNILAINPSLMISIDLA